MASKKACSSLANVCSMSAVLESKGSSASMVNRPRPLLVSLKYWLSNTTFVRSLGTNARFVIPSPMHVVRSCAPNMGPSGGSDPACSRFAKLLQCPTPSVWAPVHMDSSTTNIQNLARPCPPPLDSAGLAVSGFSGKIWKPSQTQKKNGRKLRLDKMEIAEELASCR